MDTVIIRHEIRKAESHEAATHELASLLHRRLHRLCPSAMVTQSGTPDRFVFLCVCNFINRTPTLLDTLLETARGTRREDICDAVAVICLDFFLSPPPALEGRNGLNSAMAKAYLCQRMIEELNDCCRLKRAAPLLPVDLSCSNLMVHQLIGAPLAGMLDSLVANTVQRLQELASAALSVEPEPERDEHVVRLCRHRDLLDNDITRAFSSTYLLASSTIH